MGSDVASILDWVNTAIDGAGCNALFNTRCFVLRFLPVTLLGFWLVPFQRWRRDWLLGVSVVFYSLWDVRFTFLLLAVAVVNYLGGRLLSRDSPSRKGILAAIITVDLAVLAFFKYALFFAENVQAALGLAGLPSVFNLPDIILPVGISFYTFQAISYVVDVYRRDVEATKSFVQFATYLTLFPQLIAGPIVRYAEVGAQLDNLVRPFDAPRFSRGAMRFVFGLFKKVIIADTIGRYIRPLWEATGTLDPAEAWTAAVGFAVGVYFDFSAYSDMAIGLGAMMGLDFPENFKAPFASRNPRDYWKRWHITFSTFMRDYVYIPLGGNRGRVWRADLVLILVFFLGGLWHGADWTFILWGLYNAALLIGYRQVRGVWDAIPIPVQVSAFFLLRLPGLVMFRATDVRSGFEVLDAMVLRPWAGVEPATIGILLLLLVLVALMAYARVPLWTNISVRAREGAMTGALLVVCLLGMNVQEDAFIYYQF